MIQTPTCRQRDALLCKPRNRTTLIRSNGNAIEGYTKIVTRDLEAFVFTAFQPWQLGIARKEISPPLKGIRRLNANLSGFLENRRARIRREDIRPEFRSGKFAANIHH